MNPFANQLNTIEHVVDVLWESQPDPEVCELLATKIAEHYTPRGAVAVPRCKRCNWPIYETIEEGCTETNCCMRPVPKRQ